MSPSLRPLFLPSNRVSFPRRLKQSAAGLTTRPPRPALLRRVAITGVGAVTSIGRTFSETWNNLLSGESGAKYLSESEYEGFPCRVGARVEFEEFQGDKWVGRHGDLKRTPKVVRMALAASYEALDQANWKPENTKDRDSTGIIIGSSVGSLQDWYHHASTLHDSSYKGFSHMFLPRTLTNIPVGAVATEFGFRGPISCPSTACTTGTVALGEAFHMVRHGYCDVALAGGADATVTPMALAGFGKLRALPRFTSLQDGDPRDLCKPFDVDRNGLLVGEGAAVVVLEDWEHARNRGAEVFGEIVGFGSAADAFHPVRPDPAGTGASLSMSRAIDDAVRTLQSLDPELDSTKVSEQIGYINAHATATLAGDEAELLAIENVFRSGAKPLYISSCKSSMGHMMGAAGAAELILTLWALRTKTIPMTRNLLQPIPSQLPANAPSRPIVHVKNTPLTPKEDFRLAMSNSFGFGGGNATLIVATP